MVTKRMAGCLITVNFQGKDDPPCSLSDTCVLLKALARTNPVPLLEASLTPFSEGETETEGKGFLKNNIAVCKQV